MAFTDQIRLVIDAIFNEGGIKEARRQMQQFRKLSQSTGLSMDELKRRADATGFQFQNNFSQATAQGRQGIMNMGQAADFLGSKQTALQSAAKNSRMSVEGITEALQGSKLELAQNAQGATQFRDQFTGSMRDSKQASNSTRRAMSTFRMEMLSVMFGAMALRRVISGMMRPALKTAGVFETWGAVMEILFLPFALFLQKALIPLIDIVASLPEEVRLLIGAFMALAVAGLTLGIIWAQLAMLAGSLGFASVSAMVASAATSIASTAVGLAGAVTTALSGLATTVASIAGTIASVLSAPIVAAIAVVVGAVLLLNEAWAGNWFGIRQAVGKAVKFIGKNIETLVSLLMPPIGILNKIIEAVNMMTDASLPTLGDALKGVEDAFVSAGNSMIESGNKIDSGQKKGGGFLGFNLTGKGGLLSGGIGGIGDKIGGMLGFGGPSNISTPSSSGAQGAKTEFNQNISIERGAGNESDFAFSKRVGRELQKANESTVSKMQSGR